MSRKRTRQTTDLESLKQEYDELVPIAERLCSELVNQLNRLFEEANIALGFPIQYRVKQWKSIAGKLERIPLHIKSIKDLQDLVGLRILLLFERDVTAVCSIISESLVIKHQYDTRTRLGTDQFGYSSMHFVVELPEGWLTVPTFRHMRDLKAEIQVRTLAQHIWAEASQKLQYKREDSVPPTLRRAIYRVSALLETVDLELERVLQERGSYRDTIDISGTEEELNVDLLEKTLDSLFPQANKIAPDEKYAELLQELNAFGIRTQQQLVTLIQKHINEALAKDSERVKSNLQALEGGYIDLRTGTTPERLMTGVFFVHTGLLREVLTLEFGEKYKGYRKALTS